MTERDLQLGIVAHWRSSLVVAVPNYTPDGWWECDVWGVTKAGYWVEWECKLSREDLRADASKRKERMVPPGEPRGKWTREIRVKHEVITTDPRGPSRFWYVVPDALEIQPEEVPPWAGLAVASKARGDWVSISCVKLAPDLGRRKTSPREIRLAERRMWYRYWNCLKAMNKQGVSEPQEAS